MIELDLRIHDIEDVAGKVVVFNGVGYELLQQIGEGGQAWVFPLRNLRSRLIQFVAKLYKCGPDSPEALEIRKRMAGDPPPMGFVLKALDLRVVPDEIYEYGGGLFRFQRLLGSVPDPENAYDQDRMNRAAQLAGEGRYYDAVAVYNEVLSDRPEHTLALANKALCMSYEELSPEALLPLLHALDVEPNDTELVVHLGRVYLALGWPTEAITAVEESLARWMWRYDVLTFGIDVALDWDFVEFAERTLPILQAAAPRANVVQSYNERLAQSRERLHSFNLEMTDAVQCMQREDFASAEAHLERAVAASRRNEIARANLAVCKYHAGAFREARDLLLPLLIAANGARGPSVTILTILASFHAGESTVAARLVEMIDDSSDDPLDLPGVPVAIVDSGTLEYESIEPIRDMLNEIQKVDGAPTEKIARLISLYSNYESRMSSRAG